MKKFLKILLILVLALVIAVGGLLGWLTATEYRPAAVEEADVVRAGDGKSVKEGETLKVLSWNVGYAGLGRGEDFFMDGGTRSKPDSRDTVLQRQPLHGNGTLRFRHLAAGEVRIRAVVDADSNGRWTPGDYRLQRQPEEWVMFEKTLQMREKWESEEKWNVAPKEKKAMPVPRPKLMDLGPLKPQIPSKD